MPEDEGNRDAPESAESEAPAHSCPACVTEEEYEEILKGWLPDPAERAAQMASWLEFDPRPDCARVWYERAITLAESEQGPADPRLVQWLGRYACMESDHFRRKEAEALVARAVAVADAIQEPGPAALVGSLSFLASLAPQMGRAEDARALLDRAFAVWQRVAAGLPISRRASKQPAASEGQAPADSDLDLYCARLNLAGALANIGDTNRARQVLERELQAGEDPAVLRDLARIERQAGRLPEAWALARRAAAGRNSPRMRLAEWFWADVESLLSDIERDLGRPKQARGCLRRAMAILERAGRTQSDTFTEVCCKLAVLEKQAGNVADAERLRHLALEPWQRVLETASQRYGADDYRTRTVADRLAAFTRLVDGE